MYQAFSNQAHRADATLDRISMKIGAEIRRLNVLEHLGKRNKGARSGHEAESSLPGQTPRVMMLSCIHQPLNVMDIC